MHYTASMNMGKVGIARDSISRHFRVAALGSVLLGRAARSAPRRLLYSSIVIWVMDSIVFVLGSAAL
jgi:hypothetical protein